MNTNLLKYITFNIIILIANCPSLINSITSCSIFPSLNCSCYQSDHDLNVSSLRQVYSHLYCQGNVLNKKTFQPPFGSDFPYQHRFRIVSLEFYLQKQVEIHSYQFEILSKLFSETNNEADIEISIRLNNFTHLTFHKYSLTSHMFQVKHQRRRLELRLIPSVSFHHIQNESGEKDPNDMNNQFDFSENCFAGLTVSHFSIHSYTKEGQLSLEFPFERIFNHTNIAELRLYGSLLHPGPSSLRRTFKGLIRSLTLHRHADTIDSTSFPYYFPVYSYTIHSIEANSMNLDSFIPLYTNLRGLELIKPHFEVSINRFIPTLDSLVLDIEYLNERTLIAARHVHNLKLGSSLRRIHPQVLDSLQNYLKHLDLSDVDLSDMTSDSRCHLIHFIYNNHQRQLTIIFPHMETLTECDCARLILMDIQLVRKSKILFNDELCTGKCRFSDCSTISEYFHEKYPLFINKSELMNDFEEKNNNLPSVDLSSDPHDIDMMDFLINQTDNQQNNKYDRQSARTPITMIHTSDDEDGFLMLEADSSLAHQQKTNNPSMSKRTRFFAWTSFIYGSAILLLLIIITFSIVYCLVKQKKNKHLKRVPVHV